MNAKDRKTAAIIAERLRAVSLEIETIKDMVEELATAEREKFDNMTDSLQSNERGQAIGEAADTLENAHSELDCIDIDSLADQLEELANG